MGQPISSPSIGAPKTSRSGRRSPLLPSHSGWSLSRAVMDGFATPTPASVSVVGYLRSLLAGFATGVCLVVLIWHLF